MLIMERLIKKGMNVYLYTYKRPEGLGDLDQKIHLEELPIIYPFMARRPDLLWRRTLLPALICWFKAFFVYKAKSNLVVDQEGFLTFSKLFPWKRKNCHYISFEIFIKNEITDGRQKILKSQEKKLLKKGISSLLIQGKYRYELFKEEHPGCNTERIYFLPVAPPKFQGEVKPDYIIPIPKGKKSIVYTGSLHHWAGILDLLDAFKNHWHPDFHLVIHYRFPEFQNPVIKVIQDLVANGYPVTLFIKKFVNEEYYPFLKQFNFALATYKSISKSYHGIDGKNFEIIGLASGKFNTQMMLGIPTITTKSRSFLDFKKDYNFGYVMDNFADIGQALAYCMQHEEEMRKEAKRLYAEVINPELYIEQYINHLIETK
ncbi:hypothetical protein D9M68_524810 [compost metagenome]